MKQGLSALMVGFLFAIGLGLSGMMQPAKVIGFLNLFGEWDPSLMFVMVGAIGVHSFAYKLIRKRSSPLLVMDWQVPTKTELTPALIVGAVLFGAGWGLGGYCPGPAVAAMASFQGSVWIFVVSMLVGMVLFKQLDKKFKFKR